MHIFYFQFLWFNFEIACTLFASDKYQVGQTPAVDCLYTKRLCCATATNNLNTDNAKDRTHHL